MTKWAPIPRFKLESWFVDEELERKNGEGFVFFIHTKFLLIDPLSDDPLVCTGSANFSGASLKSNDENMLLIRGNTRVADIYLTEFDRIFRHFYFRDAANEIAQKGIRDDFGLLKENDAWTNDYFDPKNVKNHRREMFFANPASAWSAKAPRDEDVFAGEGSPSLRASGGRESDETQSSVKSPRSKARKVQPPTSRGEAAARKKG